MYLVFDQANFFELKLRNCVVVSLTEKREAQDAKFILRKLNKMSLPRVVDFNYSTKSKILCNVQ